MGPKFIIDDKNAISWCILESLYKLRIRGSDQLKMYWNCTTWKSIKRYRCRIINIWKRWWREVLIRIFDCEILTPDMRKSKQVQWSRVTGDQAVLKMDQEFAINGEPKVSIREETNAVSDTTVMIVQNRHQKPLHHLSHQHQHQEEWYLLPVEKTKASVRRETNVVSGMRVTIVQNRHRMPNHPLSHQLQEHKVEVRREKETSETGSQSGKFNRQPCKYFLKGTCTKSPCEY